MDEQPGDNAMIRYSSFLGSVRNAVSYWDSWTQGQGTQGLTPALLQVTLEAGGRQVHLWISPTNLYVWGFSNTINNTPRTWAFNTHSFELQQQMANTTPAGMFNGISEAVLDVGFDSTHHAINQAAGRERNGMPTGFWNVYGAIETLATTNPDNGAGPRLNVARSLQQLVHFVAEGARLNDVEGTYRAGMRGVTANLTSRHVELTNQWGQLSTWMVGRHFGATNPFDLRLGTAPNRSITTIPQAREYIRLALGSAPRP
ncbi:ribosome-inactivating family protein [Micromonospora sp. CPCC 205558]|uniref:ribosome-inactivating family protein n=1 Tax=Micromonospora sp. CPCC 205558 TaxID=3122403 RepID=UPI002FF0F71F